MLITVSIIGTFSVAIFIFMQQEMFGKYPSGARLERIKKSPHYKNGTFQNLSNTPDLTEGATYYSVMKEFLLKDKSRVKPPDTIPSTKTNLLALNPTENVLVWFGHSSYFMQIDGKKILVDPVLSGAASPISFTTKSFIGTDIYSVEDLPEIDYLFLSHDHWDHADYSTLVRLKGKVKQVICGLGVGEHLEHWGYKPQIIKEHDWHESTNLDSGFTVHTTPARHFSGRGFSRNKSLWASFVLQTPNLQVFIGGDSGYDKHFAEIGQKFGTFDWVILENGQYDKSWKYIHMMPEEVLKAAKELNAKNLLPVHSAKFALANHDWDAPLRSITAHNVQMNVPIATPIIGEKVNLLDSTQQFTKWWETVK